MFRIFLTLSIFWNPFLALPRETIIQYRHTGVVGKTETTVEMVTINDVPVPWNKSISILSINRENDFDIILQMIVKSYNHTAASNHTYQRLLECRVEGNGMLTMSERIQYDGKNYLSLESTRDAWIAAVPQALQMKEELDRDPARTGLQSMHLQNRCTELLKEITRSEHSSTEAFLKYLLPILVIVAFVSMILVSFFMFKKGSGPPAGSIVHYPRV
ncbi:H-2 class I histocompatibility antigen, K-Q alpha chain isoform X2 [Megalops cyprinoides]|uniref:H-2 class I histocompatibility antigen, K-Q alpha chain isoform X2 n=1 Tax=Megalops cyprinoides TaxID=118141 RepID=UPI001864C656|nr:H-2 class I histocompatibility antigen, K-Q alpha chain isoform X2 [Megalops cyprinoides]XP_036410624.1 H-2 class I histocompatibility antigen, K-Q alpha chain isoform X2 [Megalops cyprinoides]